MASKFALGSIPQRLTWALAALCAGGIARAEPVISEFMASNASTLPDDNGVFSDWIEIYNPDGMAVDLNGWYLTDSASNRTKWQFPAVTLPAGGYLVVYASNGNKRDPAKPLHTNFALSAGGEYLGLIKPDGATVSSEYAPTFPAQNNDVSYGMVASGGTWTMGYMERATPGGRNSALAASGLSQKVAFNRPAGPFTTAFSLELSGDEGDQVIRYITIAPNGILTTEPTATSPLYTDGVTVDASVIVKAAVFSADGRERGPITSAQFVKLGATVANFVSRLPVVVLDAHAAGPVIKDGVDHPAWVYTYGARANGGPVFSRSPDVATPLTASVRGSSSADFPKKGYNFKFLDEQGKKRAQALFGFGAYEKWALVAPWNYDRTYIHNAVAYSLSNKIGRWAPRTELAEVFFNNGAAELGTASYAGIYVLTDRVEPQPGRVELTALSASDTSASTITGGYILKIDLKDADEYGFITQRNIPYNGYSSVVVAYPKEADMAPTQKSYIRDYVQQMEDALFGDRERGFATRTYLDFIDRASWVDHHILNTFAWNVDAFDRSAYFTKDRNGKMVAGPLWDFDRAFGAADVRNQTPEGWGGDGISIEDFWDIGWWYVISRDPEFQQDWVDRWQSLRLTEFSDTAMGALIDTYANAVGPNAAARDSARWPDNTSRFGDYAGEIAHMKTWIARRAAWIDKQFLAAPTVAPTSDGIRLTPPAGAKLAYTLDGSDPRSLGGEIAPNAILVDGPLDIPASANLHVRSYNAALVGKFPGTPWSSSVGTAASTPLSPASRLINISSRSIVGTEEDALIAGVVVADTASKNYLARAVGPTLAAFGTTGFVPDPQLSIFASGGVELYRNSDWGESAEAESMPTIFRSVGAFPLTAGSKDAALVGTLNSASYSVKITTPSGSEGIGLVELYETANNGRTVNLSTRARVRTGDGVLIGGFVVQGTAYKRMLVRAVGPTLGVFGVSGALQDPVLTLYSRNRVIATNDRWADGDNRAVIQAASGRVGAFPLADNSEDAAFLITVPPGNYSVEVRGKNNTEGVALLEIYELP